MALPELLRALREQAAERRAAELARAEEAARRIRDGSLGSLERRRRAFLAQVRLEEESSGRRAVSHARSESARSVLAARDILLDRVKERLAARVEGAATDSLYLAALHGELESALRRLQAEQVVVEVPPVLVPHVERAVAQPESVEVVGATDMGPGFRALSPADSIEIDGALRSRLEREWPRIAVEVLREVSG